MAKMSLTPLSVVVDEVWGEKGTIEKYATYVICHVIGRANKALMSAILSKMNALKNM